MRSPGTSDNLSASTFPWVNQGLLDPGQIRGIKGFLNFTSARISPWCSHNTLSEQASNLNGDFLEPCLWIEAIIKASSYSKL